MQRAISVVMVTTVGAVSAFIQHPALSDCQIQNILLNVTHSKAVYVVQGLPRRTGRFSGGTEVPCCCGTPLFITVFTRGIKAYSASFASSSRVVKPGSLRPILISS